MRRSRATHVATAVQVVTVSVVAATLALGLAGCGSRLGQNGQSSTSSDGVATADSPSATSAPAVDPLAELDAALTDIDRSMRQSESDVGAGDSAAATADE